MNTDFQSVSLDNFSRHPYAPRPRNIKETGLSHDFIADLICKHIQTNGVQDLISLSAQLALNGNIIEPVLDRLRKEDLIEIRAANTTSTGTRYALTEKGVNFAFKALSRSRYTGPAPVPIDQYTKVVSAQSVKNCKITHQDVHQAFSDTTINKGLLDQLGPAMHSGRAIMIYGIPGTGKTYICKKLTRLLGESVFIPHAIAVGESVVQIFDPIVHRELKENELHEQQKIDLQQGYDPRYVQCHRPVATSGGELTLDMLEIEHDRTSRLSHAPLQLKANNGMYIIDDLGRQRVPPIDLFNRWIVPLEEKHDYLTLDTGKRFKVPFDVILILSTNINPVELADEAFLRRLGYKIKFAPVSKAEYKEIWNLYCSELDITCPEVLLNNLFDRYRNENRPLLPCHPRDLIGLVSDQCQYSGDDGLATPERLQLAWNSYFINIENEKVT